MVKIFRFFIFTPVDETIRNWAALHITLWLLSNRRIVWRVVTTVLLDGRGLTLARVRLFIASNVYGGSVGHPPSLPTVRPLIDLELCENEYEREEADGFQF